MYITARTLPEFSILTFTLEFINNSTVPEETFRNLSTFQIKDYTGNINDGSSNSDSHLFL
jgi:hypothetical protein